MECSHDARGPPVQPAAFAVFAARGAYHSLMTAERILVVIGGAVIVIGLTAAIYAAFTMSNFVGVLGLLILVVVVGVSLLAAVGVETVAPVYIS